MKGFIIMENESCIKDIISNSLQQVRAIVDADTVVGKQILTPSGVVIVPISKVSMGFASGGIDLPAKKNNEDGSIKSFGGGGGTGVTVSPVGFLVISPEGDVELLPMTPEKTTPIEQIADIINSAPDLIGRIKNIFTNGYSEEKEDVEMDELADIEEAYRQKLAQEAADEAEQAIEDTEKLIESDTELTKEDKKRLKKEAKELKKLEKMQKKAAKKAGAISAEELTDEIEIQSAEDAPVNPAKAAKRGKISQKTLESGRIQ